MVVVSDGNESEEEGNDERDGESIQEVLDRSMPPIPEQDREAAENDELEMTPEEQHAISGMIEDLVQTLYDRGYSPNELGVVFNSFGHRMNAARYDPHEYDRIGLSITLRESLETWKGEQDHEVPPRVIADTVEELGRMYRADARREANKSIGRREAESNEE